jgi:hypothetical protein
MAEHDGEVNWSPEPKKKGTQEDVSAEGRPVVTVVFNN